MLWLFAISAVLSAFLTGPLLLLLGRIKARQVEREEGPASHKGKSGTPTMGGMGFLLAALTMFLLAGDFRYLPVVVLTLAYAAIGLTDDLLKVLRRHNQGLTFWQKIFLQVLIAGSFSLYILNFNVLNLFAIWCLFFWIFLIVGAANATNLTDGLDGLLAGCSIIAFLSFAVVFSRWDLFGGASFALIFAGALLGFLFYNFPKARLFMGDVGSLSVGAALAGLAIMTGQELLLAVIGGVFVLEALSVIIQVAAFKLWKKRVFKMAPLHHHFELMGFSELQVVAGFWTAQAILGIIGVMIR